MDGKGKDRPVKEQVVSEITGLACSTLQKQRHYGTGIPYYKLGKAVRYDLQDVYTFLDNAKVTPRR